MRKRKLGPRSPQSRLRSSQSRRALLFIQVCLQVRQKEFTGYRTSSQVGIPSRHSVKQNSFGQRLLLLEKRIKN